MLPPASAGGGVWCPWVVVWCGGCCVQEAYIELVCFHQHQLGVVSGVVWCGFNECCSGCGMQEAYMEQVCYHQHQLGVGWGV